MVQRFDCPSCRSRPLASVRRRSQRWLWGGLLLLGLGVAVLPLAVLLPPALAGLEEIDQGSLLAGQEPLYRSAGALEQRLEREAYANQSNLGLGADLVSRHCRLAAAPP